MGKAKVNFVSRVPALHRQQFVCMKYLLKFAKRKLL